MIHRGRLVEVHGLTDMLTGGERAFSTKHSSLGATDEFEWGYEDIYTRTETIHKMLDVQSRRRSCGRISIKTLSRNSMHYHLFMHADSKEKRQHRLKSREKLSFIYFVGFLSSLDSNSNSIDYV